MTISDAPAPFNPTTDVEPKQIEALKDLIDALTKAEHHGFDSSCYSMQVGPVTNAEGEARYGITLTLLDEGPSRLMNYYTLRNAAKKVAPMRDKHGENSQIIGQEIAPNSFSQLLLEYPADATHQEGPLTIQLSAPSAPEMDHGITKLGRNLVLLLPELENYSEFVTLQETFAKSRNLHIG